MAVTKVEAENIRNKKMKEYSEKIEQYIDPLLLTGVRSFDTSKLVSLTNMNVQNLSMVDFLEKIYKNSGWKINRSSGGDMRDYYDNIIFS
jgi:hypothetical protein